MDTPLAQQLSDDITKWVMQIPVLADLEIPRHVHYRLNAQYSLNFMCNASSQATALRKEP